MTRSRALLSAALLVGLGGVGRHEGPRDVKPSRDFKRPRDVTEPLRGTPPNPNRQTKAEKKAAKKARRTKWPAPN